MRADTTCRMRRRPQRAGVAAVELAMLLPLILTLLVGVLEVGRAIDVQQIMSNAAREGARQASTGQLTNTQVQNVVINYLTSANIPTSNATVSVSNLTQTGVDALSAAQLDQFKVTVTLPFDDVGWAALNYFFPAGSTITAQATWCSVKDRDYPQSVSGPGGS